MNFLNVNNRGNFIYNIAWIRVAPIGGLVVDGANSQPHENGHTWNGSHLEHAHTIWGIQVKTHHKKLLSFSGNISDLHLLFILTMNIHWWLLFLEVFSFSSNKASKNLTLDLCPLPRLTFWNNKIKTTHASPGTKINWKKVPASSH